MASTSPNSAPDMEALIADAAGALKSRQMADGHWVWELEADTTIPAEYVLLLHFLGEPNGEEERKIGNYLRAQQSERHGGWPLFAEGDLDISATVKSYWALKIIGDDIDAPHMKRAREAILAHGGAARSNVLTRIWLALYGHVPWRALPVLPMALMVAPGWFPINLYKISYWSRTTVVPFLILYYLKPKARNPRGVSIAELFTVPPEEDRGYVVNPTGHPLGTFFLGLDHFLRWIEPAWPKWFQKRCLDKAVTWIVARLNDEDGLGGIFPPIVNTVMAFDTLGYGRDHPHYDAAWRATRKLLVIREDEAYCQPCLSPVWDTSLTAHALLEAGEAPDSEGMEKAFAWLAEREITDVQGDWVEMKDAPASGWAFQYWNDYYPDVDDTAVVVMAMHRADAEKYKAPIARATQWVIDMQRPSGGWSAFETGKAYGYLDHIPFADHGAILDPETVDVSARCLSMLGQLGYERSHPVVARGLQYLRDEQEEDGSWFGRWGVNYVYGTWSALCALNAVGEDMEQAYVQKAVAWLRDQQQADGGWGEDCATYEDERRGEVKDSTPSQTAWAIMGLMAAGEVDTDAVARGAGYLQQAPRDGAKWDETLYTGTGFPHVFYLRYHGYSAFFPLWALARYRNLKRTNTRRVGFGM